MVSGRGAHRSDNKGLDLRPDNAGILPEQLSQKLVMDVDDLDFMFQTGVGSLIVTLHQESWDESAINALLKHYKPEGGSNGDFSSSTGINGRFTPYMYLVDQMLLKYPFYIMFCTILSTDSLYFAF